MRIVTALEPEAKPLIERYNLKRVNGNLMFPIYQNENSFLTISGIGKINAAAATAYLHVKSGELNNQPFLNVGIAGHHRSMLGLIVIANQITDQSTRESFYPPQITFDSLNRSPLITVEKVETEYEADAAYDMEAYGYYSSASKSTTAELAQSLKVISDHRGHSNISLNSKRIRILIENRIDEIDDFIKALQSLSKSVTENQTEPKDLEQFLLRWHFTVTQKHRLRKMIARWALLTNEEDPISVIPEDCKNANQAIGALESALLSRPFNLHPTERREIYT